MPQYLTAEEIAELLRAEGDQSISGRTVHYYAEQRLLPPPEYDGARPRYTAVHLEAMQRARALKRRGHSLDEIGELVAPGSIRPAPVSPAAIAPSAPAAIAPPAAARPLARAERGPRTLAVGPGLTLSAAGWTDDELSRIAAAIHSVVVALGRA